MARTFNDLSDAELGGLYRRRYDALCDAHDAGFGDSHPSERWAEDSETLAAYREAAASGGVAGKVAGRDDPPGGQGEPRAPVSGQDRALRSDPRKVRAMQKSLRGYDRIR